MKPGITHHHRDQPDANSVRFIPTHASISTPPPDTHSHPVSDARPGPLQPHECNFITALAALLLVVLGAPQAANAYSGVVRSVSDPVTGHSYLLIDVDSYANHKLNAAARGGYLARISSQAENNLVAGMVGYSSSGAFIGSPGGYANWAAGQPDYTPFGTGPQTFYCVMKQDSFWKILNVGSYSNNRAVIEVPGNLPRVDITGRVVSAANGAGLASVTVTVSSDSALTEANGSFAITDVDLPPGALLVASKTGFLARTVPASGSSSTKSIDVGDIPLQPSTNKPVVEGIKAEVQGIYLTGFGLKTPLTASVNWNGHTAGTVKMYVNGVLRKTISGTGPYSTELDVDAMLQPASQAWANSASVEAVGTDGVAAEPFSIPLRVIELPTYLRSVLDPSDFVQFTPSKVGFTFGIGGLNPGRTFPKLGRLGMTIGANASFDYEVGNGAWNIVATGSGDFGRVYFGKGQRTVLVNRVPKFFLNWGLQNVEANLSGSASGTATQEKGIEYKSFGASIGAAAKFEWRVSPADLLEPGVTQQMLMFPGGDEVTRLGSVILRGKPSLTGGFKVSIPEFELDSVPVKLKVALEAAYEPRILGYGFRLYVGGEGFIEVDLAGTLGDTIGGGEAYVGVDINLYYLSLKQRYVWWKVPESASAQALAATDRANFFELGEESPNWRPMERPWREQGVEQFHGAAKSGSSSAYTATAASTSTALVSNVFPDSEPALASRGAEQMLLYVRDTGAADPAHFTEIAFSRYNGSAWSAPVPMAADARGQFSPRVAYDGAGRAVATWVQMKNAAVVGTTVQEVAAEMELATSIWNPATQAWSAPVALTNNEIVDYGAQLAGPLSDGDLILTWQSNDANQLVGRGAPGAATNSRVLWRRWDSGTGTWSAESTLLPALTNEESLSLAGAGPNAVFLWSQDADGNGEDPSDRELHYCRYDTATGVWSPPTTYTADMVADRNARVLVDAGGMPSVVWQRGTDLVIDRNFAGAPSVVRAGSDGSAFASFTATQSPLGEVIVLWQELTDGDAHAQYRVYDPTAGAWSEDLNLLAEAGLQRSFSPAWDDAGKLVLAYDRVQQTYQTVTIQNDDGTETEIPHVPQPGQVDLMVARKTIVKDLAFGAQPIEVLGTTFLSGDTVTLDATIRNIGDLAAENAQVSFYDGDPAAGGTPIALKTIPGWLAAGQEVKVTHDWTIPSPITSRTVYAVIDPDNQVAEEGESNNVSSLALNGADLEVTFMSGTVLRDGSVRVVARVKNVGTPASLASELKLWPTTGGGTSPLVTKTFVALAANTSTDVVLELPAGSQSEGDTIYRVAADEGQLVPDIDRTNNERFFALNLTIDDDRDGLPRGWEISHGQSDTDAGDAALDPDSDGFPTWQEYFSGTNPNNPGSYFRAQQMGSALNADGSRTYEVSWGSVEGRLYEVQRSFNLVAWETIVDNIRSTVPLNTIRDTLSLPQTQVFYRVKVR